MTTTTNKLGLKLTLTPDLSVDSPQETIVNYGENFQKIEDFITLSGSSLAVLQTGETYPKALKVWNDNPTLGGYVGWVNLREGVHAMVRSSGKAYAVGDLVKSPDNASSYVYKCVQDGVTPATGYVPNFPSQSDAFYDVRGISKWEPNQHYQQNEIVFATDGKVGHYYLVDNAGLSGSLEPDWDSATSGTAILDNNVTWLKVRNPRWQQTVFATNFVPFGQIANTSLTGSGV